MKHPRPQRNPRIRRASTPSLISSIKRTPSDDAKRQQLKKHRLRKSQRSSSGTSSKPLSLLDRISKPVLIIRQPIRERWAKMAEETQGIVLGNGKYVVEERCLSSLLPGQSSSSAVSADSAGVLHNLTPQQSQFNISSLIKSSRPRTTFYPHYSDTLADWANPSARRRSIAAAPTPTTLQFEQRSTLTVAHRLAQTSPSPKIGILSFASPKRPGGAFLRGGDEQEEAMARLSSLVSNLNSPAAKQFYKTHRKFLEADGSGLHDHSMVFSPDVVVFRADGDDTDPVSYDLVGGDFIPPYTVDVISAVPVNAAAVRAKHVISPSEQDFFGEGIRRTMKERMARVLQLFAEKGDRELVLGAFGCGSSENKVDMVASIWAELLVCGDMEGEGGSRRQARFKDVFDKVVFSLPGKLFTPFHSAFEMRLFEAEVADAASAEA